IARYLGDGQKQVGRIRDTMRKGIEAMDRGKSAQSSLLARDVLATFLAVDDVLGAMVLDLADASMEERSRSGASLLQQLAAQVDALRDADGEGQRLAQRVTPLLDEYRKLYEEIEHGTRANTRVRAGQLAVKTDGFVRLA